VAVPWELEAAVDLSDGKDGEVDRDGVIVLQGLPARPLQVLFWSPKQQTASVAETGAFDSRRTTVSFPWPAVAVETVVE
jgi:hypothetical protein